MGTVTQDGRYLTIDTPLGKDVLLLESFSGSEGLSSLFSFNLSLVSEEASVSFDSIIGKPVAITLKIDDDRERYFHGIVSRIATSGRDDRFSYFTVEIVPWLWLLTRTTDYRIFQDLKVPDILKKIFQELGFQDFRDALTGSYTPVDYCVQHRESDFNFVSRLMEQEGIFYFFEHEKGKHTLVFADSPEGHKPCPGQPKARFLPVEGTGEREDTVTSWQVEQELRSGKYALRDYHFEMPSKSLEVAQPSAVHVGGNEALELFDYPGEFAERFNKPESRLEQVEPEGRKFARLRMEEEEAQHLVIRGSSHCAPFTAGYRFELVDPPAGAAAGQYVLTSVQHATGQSPSYVSGVELGDEPYHNSFTCIPHATPFRPPRTTPKPVAQGPQTAVVVGKGGEEIWTDKYSRVKVQFHWDRLGKRDENSSCWIRVATHWAGKQWGGVHIPRIGQEVIVGFLDGDPDQPIIMGSVYNAEQMPPNALPAGGVKSGLKSNSTKGGGGSNEMTMDDTKGKEMITIHAQFDMDTTVEHDQTTTVHNNRKTTVDVDHTEGVGVNQKVTVGSDQTFSVGANRSAKVGANDSTNVGAKQDLTVGAAQSVTVGASQTINVLASRSVQVSATDALTVGGTESITATGAISITSAASITISCGGSSIKLTPGNITIQSAGPVAILGAVVQVNS